MLGVPLRQRPRIPRSTAGLDILPVSVRTLRGRECKRFYKRFTTLGIHRTRRVKTLNRSRGEESLDRHGRSASKLWNVSNYHSRQVGDEPVETPIAATSKGELKTHPKHKGLHSQSSRRIPPELAEPFNSRYEGRKSNGRASSPGYRKENYYGSAARRVHEERPFPQNPPLTPLEAMS